MKLLKKILCSLIASIIFLSSVSFAKDNVEYEYFPMHDEFETSSNGSYSMYTAQDSLTDDEIGLLEYLVSQLPKMESQIRIPEEYQISVNRFVNIYSRYMGVFIAYEHPELFYVDSSYNYTCSTNNIVTELKPKYTMSKQEVQAAQAEIDAEIDLIAKQAEYLTTDLEKALFVHDYIISNYEYDTNYDSCTLYTMIHQKSGLSEGYTYLYKVIMNRLGIECVVVLNTHNANEAGHMWNKIKLDNMWYNVDLTYDDPISDFSCSASHDYFLLNDSEIISIDNSYGSTEHAAWENKKWDGRTDVEVSNGDTTKFSNLHSIIGASVYYDNNFWCLNEANDICKIVFNDYIVLREQYSNTRDYKWYVYGQNHLYYVNTELGVAFFSSLVKYNNALYINSANALYEYNTSNNELKTVYEYDGDDDISNTYFFGLRVRDNVLYAEYSKDISSGITLFEIKIEDTTTHSDAKCGNNLTWVLDNNGTLTISGTGDMWNYDNLSNLASWSSDRNSIKKIVINDGVTSIGDYAFYFCSNLTDINIPDSIINIEDGAFSGCTKLTNINIPKSVISVGSGAFRNCGSLNIIVDSGNSNFCDIDGVLFNKDKTILLAYAKDKVQYTYTVPEGITEIGHRAFSQCVNLENIIIPESVNIIGSFAFSYCEKLTSIDIPEGVTEIQASTFSHCKKLSSVSIPDGVNNIDITAFWFCDSLTTIVIPDGVVTVGLHAFSHCTNLTDITIPYTINNFSNFALNGCDNLTDIYFTGTLTEWNKAQITVPDNVTVHCVPEYTYKFIDDNGSILKEETIRQNSTIVPPATNPTKNATQQYTYTFVGWSGYSEGMKLTNDITFTAIYQTKTNQYTYKFIDGTSVLKERTVDYGTPIVPPNVPVKSNDIFYTYSGAWNGYEDGMAIYEDIEFNSQYVSELIINKATVIGDNLASIGDSGINESIQFTSDKNIRSAVFEIQYPSYMELKAVRPENFAVAQQNGELLHSENMTTARILCQYSSNNSSGAYEIIKPFSMFFDVSQNATVHTAEISIVKATLITSENESYELTDLQSNNVDISPCLVRIIKINGNNETYGTGQYTAEITPDYATNKNIVWSISNETIAEISQDGLLKAKKNGAVTITATSEDGNAVAYKNVEVYAYAQVNNITSKIGDWDKAFTSDERNYIINVEPSTETISLTISSPEGTIYGNNNLILSGFPQEFTLNGNETEIEIQIKDVNGYIDGSYTITVVKSNEYVKLDSAPEYSDGYYIFNTSLHNIDTSLGTVIIAAIYGNQGELMGMDKVSSENNAMRVPCENNSAHSYKIFVWDSLTEMSPLCGSIGGTL